MVPTHQPYGPRISVIVAVLNARRTLERCIDSFRRQSYTNKELIVFDGGSTDGSVDVLRANDDIISCWRSEPDRSHYHAFNKGVARSTGDWIYILGADDFFWEPDVLAKMAPRLATAYPAARVAYARVAFVSESGQVLEIVGQPWASAKRRFRSVMSLPHQGVFHHRSLFETHGVFDESYRVAGDYEFLLRELRTGRALFVPEVIVAGYQFGGGSSVPEASLRVLAEFRRAQRANGIRRPGWYWLYSYLKVRVRMVIWTLLGERRAKRFLDACRSLVGTHRVWTRM